MYMPVQNSILAAAAHLCSIVPSFAKLLFELLRARWIYSMMAVWQCTGCEEFLCIGIYQP